MTLIPHLFKPVLLLAIVVIFSFFASGETVPEHKDLKAFYFPTDSLYNPKVYKYTSISESDTDVFYWVLKTLKDDDNIYLVTEVYQKDFSFVEIIKEEINKKGAVMADYIAFETDNNGKSYKIRSHIHKNKNKVFEWKPKKGKAMHWNLTYNSLSNKRYIVDINRRRTFTGKFSDKEFKGKNYKAAEFEDKVIVNYYSESSVRDNITTFEQESYFAEGIGLIEYTRTFPDYTTVNFKLDAILNVAEWEQLKNTGRL